MLRPRKKNNKIVSHRDIETDSKRMTRKAFEDMVEKLDGWLAHLTFHQVCSAGGRTENKLKSTQIHQLTRTP